MSLLDESWRGAGGLAAWPGLDGWRCRIDHWLTTPGLYGRAIANPLTRWLMRRRTKQVFDLMAGFVHSQVLLACVKLDIFAALRQSPLTLDELGRHCQLPASVLQRLVLAAIALRLLEHRSRARIGLGALGVPFATYEGVSAMVEHNHLLYQDLTHPLEFLRHASDADKACGTGMANYWPYAWSSTPNPMSVLKSKQTQRYSGLMAASQNFIIEEILASYPFQKHRRLLDIGCGSGRFVAAVAQRAQQLHFDLFDLSAVLALAQQEHARVNLSSRMHYHPGSFLHDALPAGADVATLVRVAHDHPDAVVLNLLRKIHQALSPDGVLLLAEPMAQEPGQAPLGDAYFHLYLLAMGAGRYRTPGELRAMLQASGFARVELLRNAMPIHTRILLAHKVLTD